MSENEGISGNLAEAGRRLGDLIPEAGLDIICRIIPGFAALAAFLAVALGQSQTGANASEINWNAIVSALDDVGWPHVLIGLVACYLIGCVLDFSGNYWFHWLSIWRGWGVIRHKIKDKPDWDRFCEFTRFTPASCRVKDDASRDVQEDLLERLRSIYRHSSPANTAVLTKMLAEERMIRSIFIVCVAITIYSLVLVVRDRHEPSPHLSLEITILLVFLVLCPITFFAWFDRISRSVARPFFWWAGLDKSQKCGQTKRRSEESA